MPNWCSNNCEITNNDVSKIDAIETFLKEFDANEDQDKTGLLEFLIPNPTGEWEYNWAVANWGTKWDIQLYDWDRIDENTIFLNFDTAWGPPTTAYDTLTEQGYDIHANYLEEGMGFVGQHSGGFDESYEFDYENVDLLDDIPEDVMEPWNLRERIEEEIEMQKEIDEGKEL
jgi:hypothetical protein